MLGFFLCNDFKKIEEKLQCFVTKYNEPFSHCPAYEKHCLPFYTDYVREHDDLHLAMLRFGRLATFGVFVEISLEN